MPWMDDWMEWWFWWSFPLLWFLLYIILGLTGARSLLPLMTYEMSGDRRQRVQIEIPGKSQWNHRKVLQQGMKPMTNPFVGMNEITHLLHGPRFVVKMDQRIVQRCSWPSVCLSRPGHCLRVDCSVSCMHKSLNCAYVLKVKWSVVVNDLEDHTHRDKSGRLTLWCHHDNWW